MVGSGAMSLQEMIKNRSEKIQLDFFADLENNYFEILISKKDEAENEAHSEEEDRRKGKGKTRHRKTSDKGKNTKILLLISSITRSSRRSWTWTVRVSRAWAGSSRGALPAGQ